MQPEMNRRRFLEVGLTAIASTAVELPSSPASVPAASSPLEDDPLRKLLKCGEAFERFLAYQTVDTHASFVGLDDATLYDTKFMLSPSLEAPPWVQETETEALFKAYSFAGHIATLETSWQAVVDSNRRKQAYYQKRRPNDGPYDKDPEDFLKMITECRASSLPSKIQGLRERVLKELSEPQINKYVFEELDSRVEKLTKYFNSFAEQPLLLALEKESERADSPLAPRFKQWREKLVAGRLVELRNDPVLSRLGRLYMNEVDGAFSIPSFPTYPGNSVEVLSNPDEWPAELPGPGMVEAEKALLKVREYDPSFVHFAFSRDVEQELLKELRSEGLDFSIAAIYPPAAKALFDRCDRLYAQMEVETLNRKMVFSDHLTKEAVALRNELIEYVCGGYTKPELVGKHSGRHYKLSEFGLPRPFFFIRRFQDVADAADCYCGRYITQRNAFTWKELDAFGDVKMGCGRPPGPSTHQLTYGRRS